MSLAPPVAAAPTAEWADLVAELDRWVAAGRVARLWWRDDDAIEPTHALDDLLNLAGNIPVALAVIPATARPELAELLAARPQVSIAQHGWRHANHADSGKKSEYPAGRPAALASAEIAAGQARLKALFGERVMPVFVPPWNRLAPEFLPLLPPLGVIGLSTMASRSAPSMPPGLAAIDVHVDVVAWHDDRGFVGEAVALGMLVGQVQARRTEEEPETPLGLLTHHLVMDGATGSFLERLIDLVAAHAGARWTAMGELLS